jgi:hypothetical protein
MKDRVRNMASVRATEAFVFRSSDSESDASLRIAALGVIQSFLIDLVARSTG